MIESNLPNIPNDMRRPVHVSRFSPRKVSVRSLSGEMPLLQQSTAATQSKLHEADDLKFRHKAFIIGGGVLAAAGMVVAGARIIDGGGSDQNLDRPTQHQWYEQNGYSAPPNAPTPTPTDIPSHQPTNH